MKKRWKTKLNGHNRNYCQHCLCHHCDPMFFINSIANRKRLKRRELKLCESCGKKECQCKNRGRK